MIWSKSHLPESLWGSSYDHMMHVTDWVPTLVSIAGGEVTGRCELYDLFFFGANCIETRGRNTVAPGFCMQQQQQQ